MRCRRHAARHLSLLSATEPPNRSPQLIGDNAELAVSTVRQLQDLLRADRTLLVPILGALADMPLPAALQQEMHELALVCHAHGMLAPAHFWRCCW